MGSVERTSENFAGVVAALAQVSGDVEAARQLLALLGWSLPPGIDDIGLTELDLQTLLLRIDELAQLRSVEDSSDVELAAATAGVIGALAEALDGLENVANDLRATPDYLAATGIVDAFFPRLADLLVIMLVGSVAPVAIQIGILLGLIELRLEDADPATFQVKHVRQIVRWDRFGDTLSDPAGIVREVYGWGTPAFDGDALVTNLARVLEHFTTDVRLRPLPLPAEERLTGTAIPAGAAPGTQLFASLAKGLGADAYDIGATLYPLRAGPGGNDGGLGLSPYAFGTTAASVALSETLSVVHSASADLEGGLALILRAGREPALLTGVLGAPSGGSPTAAFAVTLRHAAREGERLELFSAPGLRFDAAALSAGVGVSAADGGDPALAAAVEGGQIRIDAERSNGFLRSILPAEGITATVELRLTWSHSGGLALDGQAGLATTLGLHRRIGPLRLDTLSLGIHVSGEALTARATLTGAAVLGPVTATIGAIGAAAALRFERGNLGAADLGTAFVPPDALGLLIEAGVVRGGGFLRAEHERGEYAGALELTFGGIGLKAIGVLADRPGGWSLMLLIYGRFPPIQLAFGFTLNAVGGFVGLHHAIDTGALQAGMQTGAFDDILFPADPVGASARIIGRLRAVFPARTGTLTVGPMVELGWGRPRQIAFIRMALLLQLDDALSGSGSGSVALTRVVLIGNLRVAISPASDAPDDAVVRLIVDFLGAWDADRKRYGFLARLRDSRIGPVDVTGSLAVWGEYGAHARFLLAAGGFNPRFKDVPAEMSGTLDRLGAAFELGRFDITLKGYFAITPGTIQAGVDLAASGKIGPVGIRGTIGFDALVYLEPYTHFIVDFRVSAAITYKGHSLAGVRISGTVEGPGRWRITGKVSFSILWWDISKSFDESWGDQPQVATTATDVRALIEAELRSPANWSAQLPSGADAMVTLAAPPGELATLAHPLGRLHVSQRIAPFGLRLERYGSGPVSGPNRFDVTAVRIGGQALAPPPLAGAFEPVREHFARAQFVDMSEEDKLTRPSFEALDAGVEFASATFVLPDAARGPAAVALDYEPTAYLDFRVDSPKPIRRGPRLDLDAVDHAFVARLARHGAAGRAAQRREEHMRAAEGARIAVAPGAPLAAATRDAMQATGVPLDGASRFSEMVAEQHIAAPDRTSARLVEAFELV